MSSRLPDYLIDFARRYTAFWPRSRGIRPVNQRRSKSALTLRLLLKQPIGQSEGSNASGAGCKGLDRIDLAHSRFNGAPFISY
jgi:hypothetical protein